MIMVVMVCWYCCSQWFCTCGAETLILFAINKEKLGLATITITVGTTNWMWCKNNNILVPIKTRKHFKNKKTRKKQIANILRNKNFDTSTGCHTSTAFSLISFWSLSNPVVVTSAFEIFTSKIHLNVSAWDERDKRNERARMQAFLFTFDLCVICKCSVKRERERANVNQQCRTFCSFW